MANTAEQWYQYEEQYRRFGADMAPAAPARVRKADRKEDLFDVLAQNKEKVLSLVLIAGIVFIVAIGATAWISGLTKQVNDLEAANQELRIELQSVDLQLKEASSISTIEEKASEDLGMVQAGSKQYVYLEDEAPPKDLGVVVNEGAYN